MVDNVVLSTKEFEQAREYWKKTLSNNLDEAVLPHDYNMESEYGKATIVYSLDQKYTDKLFEICKNYDFLIYIYLLSVFQVMLYKVSGKNDIIVGSPIFGLEQLEEYYNRHVVFINRVTSDISFKKLLMEIKDTVTNAYKNQHYPIDKVFEPSENNLISESGLFRYALVMKNLHNSDLTYQLIRKPDNEITVCFTKSSEKIEMEVTYDSGLFNENSIKSYINSYMFMLEQTITDLNINVYDIEIASKNDINKILNCFTGILSNDTEEVMTVNELFENIADKYPDKVAISCTVDRATRLHIQQEITDVCTSYYKCLTYRELNCKANQLARHLRTKGVKPGSIVGILVDSSIELIISILGTLKAGGAYLPIDADYPIDRIQLMLSDSQASILICSKHFKNTFSSLDIIDIEDDKNVSGDSSNPERINKANDLAYVIYTSGSAGEPKGVMVEHESLANFAQWRIHKHKYTQNDVTLQLLSIAFDGFGSNLYTSLLSGGEMVIVDSSQWRNFRFVQKVIKEKKVSNFSIVPSMYRLILDHASIEDLSSLRFVVLGGEAISHECITESQNICPDITLVNEYGPTECTIAVASNTGVTIQTKSVIGNAVSGCHLYILNHENKVMPIGMQGELCVSGKPLARGYINHGIPQENGFTQNPLITGNRMFRTGDYARWIQDGTIELFGRMDNQIKIRGYRVEPEEIEAHILRNPHIKDAVVVVKEDQNKNIYLCAFIVSENKVSSEELQEFLIQTLPNYMVPARMVQVDKIPLTINGKVDRKKLQNDEIQLDMPPELILPYSKLEKKLADIWRDVLKINEIGIHNNFFDMGGNSIMLMQVFAQIEREFGEFVTIADMFTYPTIYKFAALLEDIDRHKIDHKMYFPVLPPDYYCKNGNRGREEFTFTIPEDLMSGITAKAEKENVDKIEILVSAFIYLFVRISEQEIITTSVMLLKSNEFNILNLNFSLLTDFSAMINSVNGTLHQSGNIKYSVDNCGFIKVGEKEVFPLFYNNNLLTANVNPLEIWDILFGVIQNDSISFICKYNNSKINGERAKQLIEKYINVLKIICG